MQEKPLLTQLQSAYPNKFHNRCIFFFSSSQPTLTNSIIDVFFFKHELRTISPEGNNPVYNTNCTNFVLPHFTLLTNFHGDTQRHK